MQKWEYEYRICNDINQVVERLNEMGANGWELVSSVDNGNDYTFFFKRPIEEVQEKRKETVLWK